MRKTILSVFIILALIATMSNIVFSHDIPDITAKAGITVHMQYGDRPVGGGTLTLYRVGIIEVHDADYSFTLSGDFENCVADISDIKSQETVLTLAGYVQQNKLVGVKKEISKDGSVLFNDLETGLYLMIQEEAAEGYSICNPFLVTLPMRINGSYKYDVDVSTKTELIPIKDMEDDTTAIKKPTGNLPQTGQLNWPVPVLVFVGMLLFILGWALRFRCRRVRNEE